MTTSTTLRPASMSNEALAQFSNSGGQAADLRGTGRMLLAWVMVACGVGLSIWLVYRVQVILVHPDRLGTPLLPIKGEDLVMMIPSGKIVLPVAAITAVHYLVVILLLAIVGRIAVAMITHGSGMLSDSKREEERLPSSS